MKTTSHKRKIRLASLLLALVMLFATGCGSSKDESDEGDAVRVQDPAAFLGIEPYSEEAVGEKGGMQKVFWLKEECASLGKEYVDALLQVNELMLLSLREHESRTGDISDLYFLGYIGDREVHELTPVIENMPQCHVFVRVTYVEDISAVRLQVLHAGGFAFTDMGERGDTAQYGSIALPLYEDSGEEEQDAPAPQPEPQPVTPTVPDGPAFPDLSVFFHREPSGDTPDSGGRYIAFRGVPDTYADTLLNELYALLADSRYHLEPAGYEEAALTENVYRTDYLFDYTGSEKIEEVTYERIGELYALRVMFVHYEKEHTMSIAFHFSDEFVLEDPGVVTSIKDTGTPDSGADIVLDNLGDLANGGSSGSSGGGSSGGSGGGDYVAPGYDPYIPDASKLQCLTCHGDGECNSCGGSGYKFKNDIRSDCTRCTGGRCSACGGSGTR